jgi:hypothetical protein
MILHVYDAIMDHLCAIVLLVVAVLVSVPLLSTSALECAEAVFHNRTIVASSEAAYRWIAGSSPSYSKKLEGFILDLSRNKCPVGASFVPCRKGTKNCYFVSHLLFR